MRRTTKRQDRRSDLYRPVSYRPTVETLEDRLPPGDVLLGPGLVGSWLAPNIAMLRAERLLGINTQTETRVAGDRSAQPSPSVVPQTNRAASTLIFASGFSSPARSLAEQRRGDNERVANIGSAYREASGLSANLLDQLLGDDFDSLSGSSSLHRPLKTPGSNAGFEKPSLTESGGGGATGGAPRSLGEGPGPSAPLTPNMTNGSLMGNGSDGSAGASSSVSAPPAPNLITGGHFANAVAGSPTSTGTDVSPGNSHGGIVPFTSGVVWPSDTPPTCPCACTLNVSSGGGQPSGGGPSGGSGGSGGVFAAPPFMIEEGPGVIDHSISSALSPSGARYFDGEINITDTDLSVSGFGSVWAQTRSWSNGTPPSSFNGTGVIDMNRPYLLEPNSNDSYVVVVSSATEARFYNQVGSNYIPQFFVQDQLTHDTSNGEFVLTDTVGNQIHFWDWTASLATERGQFKNCTDPYGNQTGVTSWTSDGKVAEMQRTDTTNPNNPVTESYLYTYLGSPDPNAGMISNITLRRKVGNGTWDVLQQVAYDYYDGTSQKPYGNLGDLRTAKIEDATMNIIDTMYYRYYTNADKGTIGYTDGLKYYFNAQSYARLAADVSNPLMATDTQVAPYADDYFEYDPTTQRVTKAVVQASGCSACTGGQGTFTYSYSNSSFANDYNNWYYKTVETLPDGSTDTVYANFAGETMLDVFQNSGQKWETFYEYDGSGRIMLNASPSALTGYNDSYADLIDQSQVGDQGYLSSNTGLIELTDYYKTTTATSTTAGGAAGSYEDTKLEQGRANPMQQPILLRTDQYIARTGATFSTTITIYPLANSTVYHNTDGSGPETTSYSYSWFTGTTQPQSLTVTLPAISTTQNGSGSTESMTYDYDNYERLSQTYDRDNFNNQYYYDSVTGALNEIVVDAGTTGHLNLTTTWTLDHLGRPTKETDPITNADPTTHNVTYTVYNDPKHEVRVYPGWTGTTTTGPTQVYREDRAHDPSYTESFTMSATPHVTNGQPDGTEAYAELQSLSRTITNRGGQVIEKDDYFNLGGVPYSSNTYLGTANVNYYATQYAYDTPRGWLTRVLSPTGTINRTVYDALGRVVSTWVGTNDTPASGSWSPTNNTAPSNMVQVTGNVYDGGNAGGDSNLTQITEYPGGTAVNRVTQNYYDWRDRLVASKQGVQGSEDNFTHRPIFYYQYDNLDEITTSQRYDGDGVTISSTSGVPNPPNPSLLRAQTTTAYDNQGRVYQSNVFSVDQSNGTVSANNLTTNTWYNHRGLVVKVSPPGGLVTKTTYDGAGRPTVVYGTDAYLDSTWSDANTVSSNNNVLSQTGYTYDKDGNVTLVTAKDRFDNETHGGPLSNPFSSPLARVYYVANFYDAANRLTDTVNVGTNGGTQYTVPMMVPQRSATVLVTSTGYQADDVQQVALTGSPTGGTFTLTYYNAQMTAQTTSAIAYNATASTVQSALQNLSFIGSGNVLVSGPAGGPWQVRFAGTMAGTPELDMTGNGSGLTGGISPSVSVGTTSQGGDAGRPQMTTDPLGLVSKTDYDLLDRPVRTIQNFVAFAPSNSADQTTQYTYDGDGHTLSLTAVLPSNVLETTQYTYGVTGSVINSNDLLASVTYPANGHTNTENYTYNALGQVTGYTDRNGNTHAYTYDILGREISDAVTTLGSGVDGTVLRLDTAYDTGGRPYDFTSYADTAGHRVVNEVQDVYNGLGQLVTEYQSHAGAVNTSNTPKVQYAYSFVSTSGGPNHSRLVSMTYPNGRVLNYNYNSGVDDRISRLSSLSESAGNLESYTYLGLGTVVQRSQNNGTSAVVNMSYIIPGGNPDGGDKYTGLDRFGRVVEQRWVNPNTSTVTDDFLYTYDQDSNVLTRNNALDSSFNEQYSYDTLNRLTSFTRGSTTQSWGLDAVGNWSSYTNNGGTQNRSFNNQNEITAVNGNSTILRYDNNGNATSDLRLRVYTYDAWNRMVKVTFGSAINTYAYDALGRRLSSYGYSGNIDFYYSTAWQVLEEDTGGVMQTQYVWSPLYVDALVERDASGTRLYVQQDANWNVTAVVDNTGTVQKRMAYTPYGSATFYTSAWASDTNSINFFYLFQAGRYDTLSFQYNFRNRDLSPELGRWMEQDPIGYAAGDSNLYDYEASAPPNITDPTGLLDWKFYFWQAPKAFGSGFVEGLGNVALGAVNVPIEIGKFGYDVGRAGVQAASLGTNAVFGTGVYQYEPSSSAVQGMVAASAQGKGGQYVGYAMANAATLGGLGYVQSGIEALRTGDSTQFSQNAGAFAVNIGLTITVCKAVFPKSVSSAVSVADAVKQGLVRPGGNLQAVLVAIEKEFANNPPKLTSGALQAQTAALNAIAKATGDIGLEPGQSIGALPGQGDVVLQNVGGIITTIKPSGQIIITNPQGQIILSVLPK
jgi:RHS repeat-associated protein